MNLATWLRMLPKLEQEYVAVEETLAERIGKARVYVDGRLDQLEVRIDQLRDLLATANVRVVQLEAAQGRVEVVDPLPVNAARWRLVATPGDPNLYVGTGPTSPLRKIPTQPL